MTQENGKNLIVYSLVFISIFLINLGRTEASTSGNIDITVATNVCGDNVATGIEDCDGTDLNDRTCTNLGYDGGTLGCDASCSFDTTDCEIPIIDPTDVAPDELSSLLATGLFTIPGGASIVSTPSITVASEVEINIPVSGGTSTITLPEDVVITRSDSENIDPTTLSASSIATNLVSGFAQNITVSGALQWGISNVDLEFDNPINISIYVGTSLSGLTLSVFRSESLNSGWTANGIVAPATCIVTIDGLCNFQVTKASYYTATGTSTPGTGEEGEDGHHHHDEGETAAVTTEAVSTQTPIPFLPQVLAFFDMDRDGRINIAEVYSAVKSWVTQWRASTGRCDVNYDGECNLKDLSILLFYVGR
jgi:hypothetical protein